MASRRIRGFPYQGKYFYFITICCDKRINYFKNIRLISEILPVLKSDAQQFDFQIWAYCFMPDHVHFLLAGNDSEASLLTFINHFNQKSGYQFKIQTGKRLWQSSYFERVLRRRENVLTVCHYIFQNPVRAGLVQDYRQWPFSGSEVFDWKRF